MNRYLLHNLALGLISLFFLFSEISAQYVRKQTFTTEQERRAVYELDDWISYLPAKRLTNAAVGTDFIYFATLDGGILRYHLYENQWHFPFTVSNGLPSNRITEVIFDNNTSLLWAKTDRGNSFFDPASREWRREDIHSAVFRMPSGQQQTPANNSINKNIFYDRQSLQKLPVFFANGDYTITGEWTVMDRFFREFPIVGFVVDNWERVWFLVDGLGVGIGDMFTQRVDFQHYGLPYISPRAIQYHSDDLWIGGVRIPDHVSGIVRWRSDTGAWEYYEERWISGLFNENVHAISDTGDTLWFGTEYGVTLFDLGENRWKNINATHGLISNFVLDIAVIRNDIFVATDLGISRINRKTGKIQKTRDRRFFAIPVNQFAKNGDTLWAATDRGIYRYTHSRNLWEFVHSDAILRDSVITAVQTFENEVWFASSTGIMWLNLKTGRWEDFPQISLDVLGPYTDIEVNEQSVWVATQSGLLKYDKQRKYWRQFTKMDGLPDDRCYRILLDGDYIWVVNESGLTEFYWNNPARLD